MLLKLRKFRNIAALIIAIALIVGISYYAASVDIVTITTTATTTALLNPTFYNVCIDSTAHLDLSYANLYPNSVVVFYAGLFVPIAQFVTGNLTNRENVQLTESAFNQTVSVGQLLLIGDGVAAHSFFLEQVTVTLC